MPKATFFNLPEEKRTALVEACKQEFSRVPVHHASIANIVKAANIARGSFYQYFEDKEDAYFHILHEKIMQRNRQFIVYLKENEGNLFEAITLFYYELLKEIPKKEEYHFFRNSLLNVTHQMESIFNEMIESQLKQQVNIEKVQDFVNKQMLNIHKDDELPHVIQIITAVAFRNFVEFFKNNLTNEEAIEKFKLEMDLLKRGLAK